MDTKRVSILKEVLQLGSFSKAAEKLNYSKSALTNMVKNLEDELGIEILSKTYNGISLTPAGQEIMPCLDLFLESYQTTLEKARMLAKSDEQIVRIASYPSISNVFLGDAIRKFKKEYPDIFFTLTISHGEKVADLVLKGEADIGFMDSYNCKSLTAVPIYNDTILLIAPKTWIAQTDEPVTFDVANYYPFLISDFVTSCLAPYLGEFRPKTPVHLTANSGTSIMSMVASENGLCIVSHLDVGFAPKNVSVLQTDPKIERHLVMGYRSMSELSEPARKAAEFFKKYRWEAD